MKLPLIVALLLFLIMAGFMRGWWQPGLPLVPREENIPQLAHIWNLRIAADQGVLWTAWNPLLNAGAPNLIQRSYLMFAPLAQLAATAHLSVDWLYRAAVLLAFTFSGLGMYQLLRTLKLEPWPSFIGALAYMLSPPHLTLGSDLLDFNFFWASIPWLIYLTERRSAALTGLLLALAFLAGNTYFVTILPFLCLYAFMRLGLSRFGILTLGFFLSFSAFIILPSALEQPHTWLSQEITRRQIIDLPQASQILRLFLLRWQDHSPLAWDFDTRYPDMSWYLGTVTVALSILALMRIKLLWRQLLPGLVVILSLTPFFFVMSWPPAKILALRFLEMFPSFQSVFDRTYRLFLLPSFILALFSALGAANLLRRRFWLGPVVVILLLVDFLPLSAYFFTAPKDNLTPSVAILNQLNSGSPGRYWFPFTFVPHLPKYRLEYTTSYITRPRINSPYSYTAMAPRYTAKLFEQDLFAALETNRQSVEYVSQLLNLGDTRYILFHRQLFNYEPLLPQFQDLGWQEVARDDHFILLEKTNFVGSSSRLDSGHITTTVTATVPIQVMVSESWYPGWQITIDNQPVALLRSNSAFLGVDVPAGSHRLDFRYQPPWYYTVGKLISLIALITFGYGYLL